MSASVLTLVRGRERQLANLVRGLEAQTVPPLELVVAAMQDAAPRVEITAFPVRSVLVPGEPLPLAAARNAAARAAFGEHLILLDVDCIPSPTLVASYVASLAATDGCLMGEVRYLTSVPTGPTLDFAALASEGVRHVAKPAPPNAGHRLEADHGELWGLSFALRKATFWRAGGFDERFAGYGGEETDFAAALEAANVPLYTLAGALAFHQAHRVHIPPLHRFDDIVRNASLFHRKWGRWCMDYWLGQFAKRGLIGWAEDAGEIIVLRPPDDAEVAASLAPEGTLYS